LNGSFYTLLAALAALAIVAFARGGPDLVGASLLDGSKLLLRYLPTSIVASIPIVGGLIVLVDILFIFGSEQRCIHDLIAGTKVVQA